MGKPKEAEPRFYKDPEKDRAFKKRFNIRPDRCNMKRIKQYITAAERLG